ncbi:hypothetical protein BDP27DRAFT_131120 [Rhodocollybia butyracea]|uniref:FHA domain-containing protein n=1 Tax=Rhodocollybia butyracea TaxID=206335 RepID=A0A9P5P0V7_9AGAR|nr:hypothetical protein BDP27DRAFT_131120 [Rhodocollybia butyracea]
MDPATPHAGTESPPLRSTILGSFLRGRPRNSSTSNPPTDPLRRETSPSPNGLAQPLPLPRGRSSGGAANATTGVSTTINPDAANPTGLGFSSMLRRRRSAGAVAANIATTPTSRHPVSHRAPSSSHPAAPPAPFSSTSGPFRLRLVPHLESRRSLRFDAITRDMRVGDPALRIGRFTDRSGNNTLPNGGGVNNNNPNSFKLAFKSKVVSRAHAELWVETTSSGPAPGAPNAAAPKFFIRDTKSSSGTFLNHIRLAPAGQESRPYQLKDGDLLQLGVDYQGGSEDIYKSVKIRIELGREWQSGVNKFNTNAIKNLKTLAHAVSPQANTNADGKAAPKKKGAMSVGLPDCCICLFPLSIRQSLFISGPCSHSFHFKCIRPLLETTHYR